MRVILPFLCLVLLSSNSIAQTIRSVVDKPYGGIGMLVRQGETGPEVMGVYKNSPAEKAGLKSGDIIMEVNGKTVDELYLSQVIRLIRGEVGTELEVKVRDADSKGAREVTLTRARIARRRPPTSSGLVSGSLIYDVETNGSLSVVSGDEGDAEHQRAIFVLGAVVRPGAYPWQEDTRLLQAILRAGAFRPDARAQDTFVVRDHKLIHVDPVAILRENSPPFLLQPFDVVVVGTKEGSVPFIPPSRD